MSYQARYRDIAALLARGVLRVKKQPVVTNVLESPITANQDVINLQPNHVNNDSEGTHDQTQHGGDQ